MDHHSSLSGKLKSPQVDRFCTLPDMATAMSSRSDFYFHGAPVAGLCLGNWFHAHQQPSSSSSRRAIISIVLVFITRRRRRAVLGGGGITADDVATSWQAPNDDDGMTRSPEPWPLHIHKPMQMQAVS